MQEACSKKGIYEIQQIPKNLLISSVDLDKGTVYLFSSFKKEKREYGYDNTVEYINKIPIAKAVRASCSFPGVFSPCHYQ